MRRDSIIGIALLLLIVPAACETRRDDAARGAASPRALLDKLLAGLDALDPQVVSTCFDPETAQGEMAAQLSGKALTVLARGRQLARRLRARFGEAAAARHASLPGPALLCDKLRSRLRDAPIRIELRRDATSHVEQRIAYIGEVADREAQCYERAGVWYLGLLPPFAGDPALCTEIGSLLDLLAGHNDRALKSLERSSDEADWRRRMRESEILSGATARAVTERVVQGLAAHGLLWK